MNKSTHHKKAAVVIPPKINGHWIIREEGRTRLEHAPYAPYQAAVLVGQMREKLNDIVVDIVDAQLDELNWAEVNLKLRVFNPDLVIVFISAYHLKHDSIFIENGYTTIVVMTPASIDISEAIKINDLPVGIYLKQEREWTLITTVKALFENERLEKIPGLIIKTSEAQLLDTGEPAQHNLTRIAFPDFLNLRFKEYLQRRFESTGKRTTLIETMHGCLFNCAYCSHGNTIKNVTYKSAEQVVKEIGVLVNQFKLDHLEFLDSEFAVNLKRAKTICRMIIHKELKFTWYVNNRIDLVDEELLDLMKRAGCVEISYGIETADPYLQKLINKNLDLEIAAKNIALTKRAGIGVSLFMMIGLPGENRNSIEKNIQFLLKVKPDKFEVATLFLIPGTSLYKQMIREQRITSHDWNQLREAERMQIRHEYYRNIGEINSAARYMRKKVLRKLAFSNKDKSLPAKILCFLGSFGYHERMRALFPKLYYGLIHYYQAH